MDFIQSMMWDTAAVPVFVSILVAAGCRGVPRVGSFAGVLAVSAGFFCGWASQKWTTLSPVRYLDWLPYVSVGLAVCAVPSCLLVSRRYAWPLIFVACATAASFLVPDFPKLQPSRPVAIAVVTLLSVVVVFVLDRAEAKLPSRILPATLMVTGTAASLVLAQSFGLKFAQLAGMLTASLAGPLICPGKDQQSATGLPLVFVPMVCNLMFMGFASSSSDVPAYSFAIIPITAIPLWILATGAEVRSKKRIVATAVGVAALIAIAVVPALLAHPPWLEEY